MAVMAGLGVALALSSPLAALAEEARADAAPASVTDAAAAPLAEGADQRNGEGDGGERTAQPPADSETAPGKETAGSPLPSSRGETRLYVVADASALTTPEGKDPDDPDGLLDQIRVTIPVAIHYVADSAGTLSGPKDNVIKFSNNSTMPVHVASASVSDGNGAAIVTKGQEEQAEREGKADSIWLSLTNSNGDSIDLGDYKGERDLRAGKWNIARSTKPSGEERIADDANKLYLNGLTGRISGFGGIDPAKDTQVGEIHWTVRPGTNAEPSEAQV